jgi:hypothetical protein
MQCKDIPDDPGAVEYIAERLAFDAGVRWGSLFNQERSLWRDIARKKRQAKELHRLALRLGVKPGRELDANNVSKEAAALDGEWRQMLAGIATPVT